MVKEKIKLYGLNWTDQELLRLTEDFTLDDWNVIRTEEHWEIKDSMPYVNMKNEFLLNEVKKYIREKNFQIYNNNENNKHKY